MRSLPFLALFLTLSATLYAETWERFRGPDGAGVAIKQNMPTQFSESKGLVWKIDLPGSGNSSPIVWNDRMFVQSASPDGGKRYLICLNPKTGATFWQKEFTAAKAHIHKKNSLASATPATDGQSVYAAVWDGSEVTLRAFTVKGEPMWEKNLGKFKSEHGAGASPIIYKDKVYFAHDMDGDAQLYAFDGKSGAKVWAAPRKAFRASYSAPQVLEKAANGAELIITSTTAITSYNPDSGSQNWSWEWTWRPKTKPLRTIASSLEMDGILYAFAGDGGGDRAMVALNLPKSQGAKPTQVWSDEKKLFPYVPCVLSHGDHLYFVNDRGFAGCVHAKTGDKIWFERLPEATFTASPVLIDGKMYACSEEGDVFVIAANPKFAVLAKNRLGERIRATPAVADGRLFIRGSDSMFCFGKKD